MGERRDALGELLGELAQAGRDEVERAALLAVLSDLRKKLPADAMRGEDGVALDDAFVVEILPEVRDLLLASLLEGEPA